VPKKKTKAKIKAPKRFFYQGLVLKQKVVGEILFLRSLALLTNNP